jgi:hypothetical protein
MVEANNVFNVQPPTQQTKNRSWEGLTKRPNRASTWHRHVNQAMAAGPSYVDMIGFRRGSYGRARQWLAEWRCLLRRKSEVRALSAWRRRRGSLATTAVPRTFDLICAVGVGPPSMRGWSRFCRICISPMRSMGSRFVRSALFEIWQCVLARPASTRDPLRRRPGSNKGMCL